MTPAVSARSEAQPSATAKQSSKDLVHIRRTLRRLVQAPEAERWLTAPNARLGGLCPLDSIKQGKSQQVRELLACLEEGIHV